MKLEKYFSIVLIAVSSILYADNENYDNASVSEVFIDRKMNNSTWVNAEFDKTFFINVESKNSDFTSAKLGSTNFINSDLQGAKFDNASLFDNSHNFIEVTGCNFNNASFRNVTLASYYDQYYNPPSVSLPTDPGRPSPIGFALNFNNCSLDNVDFSYAYLSSGKSVVSMEGITSMRNSNFSYAILSAGCLRDREYTLPFSMSVNLSNMDLSYSNFSNATLASVGESKTATVSFSSVSFRNSNLEGANFESAILVSVGYKAYTNGTSVDFSNLNLAYTNFTRAQLSVYYNGNQNSVRMVGANLTSANFENTVLGTSRSGVNFSKAILHNSNFTNARFTSAVNMTYSDLRGANFADVIDIDTVKTKNTIMADGRIENFSMVSSDDNFSIRKYAPASEGGEMISAKISETAAISGGAALTLENGAELEVIDAASFSVANGSSIIINTDADSSTKVLIASDAALEFEAGSILSVNIECDEAEYETLQVSIMDFEDGACITGLDALVKGETILLSVNDSEWLGDWDYSIENNQMLISIIPEPATVAAILGALALTFVIRYKKGHRKNEI